MKAQCPCAEGEKDSRQTENAARQMHPVHIRRRQGRFGSLKNEAAAACFSMYMMPPQIVCRLLAWIRGGLFEGVNDLGGMARNGGVSPAEHAALVTRWRLMSWSSHAHVSMVFASLEPPSHRTRVRSIIIQNRRGAGPLSEADRQPVNQWIRATGHFDAVIDFDKVAADPQHLYQLLPVCDRGDRLHPSRAGYRAMADAVPVVLLAQ